MPRVWQGNAPRSEPGAPPCPAANAQSSTHGAPGEKTETRVIVSASCTRVVHLSLLSHAVEMRLP